MDEDALLKGEERGDPRVILYGAGSPLTIIIT